MFKKFFSKDSKESEAKEQLVLSPAITRSIFNVVGARSIPTMPSAAQKAFQLSTDPNAEARDFIDVIESDESLSARVLKIANSVYFDRGRASKTIEESVTVIGINELRSLLNATTLSEIFPSNHSARSQLWANDIATGLICRSLVRRFSPDKEDLAFLGGLMHDIGKLLLLQRAPSEYARVLELVRSGEQGSFCKAEEQLFPFDHTEAGHLIAEQWNFGPELTAIIRYHHLPWEELEPGALVSLVKASDLISHALGLGLPPRFGSFRNHCEESLTECLEFLKISAEEKRDFLTNCKRTFDLEFEMYVSQT